MRKYLLLLVPLLAVSCELEDFWESLVNDPKKGTEKLTDIELGYYDWDDSNAIEKKVSNGKTVEFSSFVMREFTSKEFYESSLARTGGDFDENFYVYINTYETDGDHAVCRLDYSPVTARVDTVLVECSDESILSLRPLGTNPVLFRMDVNGIGECDVKVTAKGKNTMEKNYHIRVVSKIAVSFYTTSFWKYVFHDHMYLKFKTLDLPRGIKKLYMNMRDSVTVIGMSRIVDQRLSETEFHGIYDTVCYPLVQKTRKFKERHRIRLRNVIAAADRYNFNLKAAGYIRISAAQAESLSGSSDVAAALKWSVCRSGSTYLLDIAGTTVRMDRYQVNWINNVIKRHGRWPLSARVSREEDGNWYLVFAEPYICKQIRLGVDILATNPYVLFDVTIKRSDNPLDVDDDEEDPDGDCNDESTSVVDSLGTELSEYFAVEFVTNLNQAKRDSLSRELEKLTEAVSDSTKWHLYY